MREGQEEEEEEEREKRTFECCFMSPKSVAVGREEGRGKTMGTVMA